MDEEIELGSIHIRYYMTDTGGPNIGLDTEGELDIVTQLGLVEMARERLLADAEVRRRPRRRGLLVIFKPGRTIRVTEQKADDLATHATAVTFASQELADAFAEALREKAEEDE